MHDDNKLFEMLILEGIQAGLSWITVLKKREDFREAFNGFDPGKVAVYDHAKIQELLANEGIIRNRIKVNAAVTNAGDRDLAFRALLDNLGRSWSCVFGKIKIYGGIMQCH